MLQTASQSKYNVINVHLDKWLIGHGQSFQTGAILVSRGAITSKEAKEGQF